MPDTPRYNFTREEVATVYDTMGLLRSRMTPTPQSAQIFGYLMSLLAPSEPADFTDQDRVDIAAAADEAAMEAHGVKWPNPVRAPYSAEERELLVYGLSLILTRILRDQKDFGEAITALTLPMAASAPYLDDDFFAAWMRKATDVAVEMGHPDAEKMVKELAGATAASSPASEGAPQSSAAD